MGVTVYWFFRLTLVGKLTGKVVWKLLKPHTKRGDYAGALD